MHVYYHNYMRTTIDIPASLRQKLIAEAAVKNLKGYSSIIVRALQEYFDKQENSKIDEKLHNLRGSLTANEYEEAKRLLETGRTEWRM